MGATRDQGGWWPFAPPKPAAFGMHWPEERRGGGGGRQRPIDDASSSPSCSSSSSRSLASAVGPAPAVAGERAAAAAVEALAGVMQRQRKRRSTEPSASSSPSPLSPQSRRRSNAPVPSSSSSGRQRRPRRSPSTGALRGGGSSGGGGDFTGASGADKKPGGGWWPFGNRSSPSSSSSPSSPSSSSSSTWGEFFDPKKNENNNQRTPNGGPPPPEERILISEIVLQGIDDDPRVAAAARAAMMMRPNFAYTLSEVHEDIRRLFDTGFFSAATPTGDDTRDGVRLTLALKPHPRLRSIVVTGADSLPAKVIQDAFAGQAGKTINYGQFREGLDSLSRWYDDRGIPAKVTVPADRPDGSVDLHCAEPRVSSVSLVFVDRETGEPKAAPAPKGGSGGGSGSGSSAANASSSGGGNAFGDDDDDDDGEKSLESSQQPYVPPGGSGYTRPEVVLRQLRTSPGLPWSSLTARADIDAVYATGLFEDVNVVPSPAEGSTEEDPRVDVTLSVCERKTGGLSAGGGISAQGAADGALPGFIGSASFSQRNLFGLGQKLAATLEVGQVDKLFRVHHSDPWILGDPHRTSRVASLQNTRSSGAPIYGAATLEEEEYFGGGGGLGGGGGSGIGGGNNNNNNNSRGGGGDYLSPSPSSSYFPADSDAGALDPSGQYAGSPSRSTAAVAAANAADAESPIIISRLTGGVEYSRPLSVGWTGTLGLGWQRASAVDEKGRTLSTDAYGAPLTHAGGGRADTLATALLRASYAGAGGEALLSLEQALPLRPSWLNFNRVRVRAERRASLAALGLPALRASATARGGAVFGDLPPYEAFPLGGTNSVRGYGEGSLGTGRAYAEATAELLFPLPVGGGALEGCLFADVGSDLDTGAAVPGDPASARGKPGSGAGIGVGVRIDSPVGPLRLECALSDRLQRRFHLGIGSHG